MTIYKKFPISRPEYHRIHARLKRKLNKIAFNAHYKCQRCGCHNNLQMHIPNCDPALIDQPGFFTILCKSCHNLI
jgi:hypothetical protein